VKVLLDTHAFLWWLLDTPQLSDPCRRILGDPTSTVLVSAVTGYELAYKAERGRLSLPESPQSYVPSRIRANGFDPLSIDMAHAVRAANLPLIHGDPFDRILIAQAQIEGIPLLTADPAITRYDVETIW
jgi:PIN domain nuclease of toxin-antitoxin system